MSNAKATTGEEAKFKQYELDPTQKILARDPNDF